MLAGGGPLQDLRLPLSAAYHLVNWAGRQGERAGGFCLC